ncbi:unnamed protein product [Orchesella dallaii]|uniref:MAP kinase-activating death domain protein n=1 Tax=Orchesella dallaii TaxID=48710 RepID=A0ABP1PZH7_9HEXA
MSEKPLCPRLADYIVVVGSRTPNNQTSIQPPELLRRYPTEDHKDFPLPLDVVYFCQPEGCVLAGPKKPVLRDAVSFVFTLTDKDSGKTRYGVCLNFYRSTDRSSPPSSRRRVSNGNSDVRRQSWRKSLEKSSDSAFSSDHRSGVAPSDSERDCSSRRDSSDTATTTAAAPPPPPPTTFHSTNPFLTSSAQVARLEVNPTGNESESGGSQPPSPKTHRRRQRCRSHSLTSLCLLSHHPFFSSFRQCLSILKKLIDACHDNTLPRRTGASKIPPKESLWNVLTGRAGDGASSVILHNVREIETWILRLLSSPVPVPGNTRVELEVLPPDLHSPLVFALPDKTRFSLTDFPLHLPLELLGVESCLQVLTLILLECKVVIQSRDYSALSMSVLALVTMLYPLEYMFPVIPLLPTCMSCAEQLLLAPTPYIIGIPASFLPYKKHFRLPEDVWLVDLDANRISGPSNAERDSCNFVPALPEPEASVLRNHLKQLLKGTHVPMNSGGFIQALTSMSSAPFPELSSQHQPTQELHIEMNVSDRQQGQMTTPAASSSSTSSVAFPSSSQPSSSQQQQQQHQHQQLTFSPPSSSSSQQAQLSQQQQQQSSSKEGSAGTSPASSSLGLPGGLSATQSPQRSSVTTPTHQIQQLPGGHGNRHPTNFNPLIYGNDVDSVDVATRIAMVRFFNSPNLLANFSEHTRTLRLYPRPVVAFQISSFLRSRPHPASQFLCRFAKTQAVEYLAEWSLAPTNLAFLRVQTGVYDPTIIGDKAKWYAHLLEPINFNIYTDVPGLCSVLRGGQEVSVPPTDESGSDSDRAGSGESTSSYSSLSDFVSELASSDLSPIGPSSVAQRMKSYQQELENEDIQREFSAVDFERGDRNVTSLCSGLDSSTVYNPPISLQYPCDFARQRKGSESGSGSGSGSESSASSGAEDASGESRRPSVETKTSESRKGSDVTTTEPVSETSTTGAATSTTTTTTTTTASSLSVTSSEQRIRHPSTKEPVRQSSFGSGSLFGQIATQAKELVKETKRQSSQEGLLSQVDRLKSKTKEKLSEVRHSSSSGSEDHSFLAPLEQLTTQAKKAADNAGKSVHVGLSKTALDDITIASKSTWEDLTKTAKKGLMKSRGDSAENKEPEVQRRESLDRRDSTSSLSLSKAVVPQIKGDVGRAVGRDFFSNMSSELNGLASQTSSMFSDLFGGGGNRSSISACASPIRAGSPAPSVASSTGSLPAAVLRSTQKESPSSSTTANISHGPFPTGRKGLVERSNLIKHTTSHLHPQKQKGDFKMMQKLSGTQATSNTSAENQAFISEVANQVLAGEGVGWLRVGRLKKLFEDESYRVMAVAKLNKTLERKIGPDDHIDDVCITKPVWKGMLKMLQLLIGGLEHSSANRGLGGMASAFQILEIAHTHYWTKDINDISGESGSHYSQYLEPTGLSPGAMSMGASPVSSVQVSPEPSRRPSAQSGEHSTEETGSELFPSGATNTSDIFRDILQTKKPNLMSRLSSSESHIEGPEITAGPAPSTTNVVINPSWPPQGIQLPGSSGSKAKLTSRLSQMSLRSTVSDTELEQGSGRGKRSPSVWSSKSALAAGLRYHAGSLIPTGSSPTSPENGRMYVFEGLLKERSFLWEEMQFWEDVFLDAVAQERELVGMDQGPREMMDRYQSLSDSEKKRLEHEEDRLLATQLYNVVSFMLMMDVNRQALKQKIRRLLGKCHMGLVYSQEINQLLEQVTHLRGNAVDLKPVGSRLAHRQTFAVHAGSEPIGDLLFMEVRDDGLVLRNVAGAIVERWWWERLVNMTYSPKTKVLCLWRRNGGQTQLHKYHSRKCRQLYQAIKEAMERAAARRSCPLPGTDLGGEFPVEDMATGQCGLLQVCLEGVGLLFANSKFFVRLDHIRKCFTQKGGIFVLEEYNPKSRQVIQRKFKSAMAAEMIALHIHRMFSVYMTLLSLIESGETKEGVRPLRSPSNLHD